MWDLIVSVPDHCLSFYFENTMKLQSCFQRYRNRLPANFAAYENNPESKHGFM